MLTIQPKDDAFYTVKCKTKHNRRCDVMECWYECSRRGHTFIHGFNLNEHHVLAELPVKCQNCERKVLYWM